MFLIVGRIFVEYQMLYALHLNTDHAHIHFVMNTVSFLNGHKYADGYVPFFRLKRMLEDLHPWSQTALYWSDSESAINRYSERGDNAVLSVG